MSKRLQSPIHPGAVLREDYLLPMGISTDALAEAIHVPSARVSEIVDEMRGITADTALRLARYFGTDARSWLNLQQHYELECAKRDIGPHLLEIHPRAA